MTKDSIELIMAIVAVIVGGAGLLLASIAITLIVGVKNSTHQVIWKPLDEPKTQEETFEDEEVNLLNNPNKKFKKFNNEMPKEEKPFADLDAPEITSNKW